MNLGNFSMCTDLALPVNIYHASQMFLKFSYGNLFFFLIPSLGKLPFLLLKHYCPGKVIYVVQVTVLLWLLYSLQVTTSLCLFFLS